MAGTKLPGNPGVTVYPPGETPPGSYVVKNADGSVYTDPDGNTYAGRDQTTLEKLLPYLVGAAFVAPYAAAGIGALAGGGGEVTAATTASGLLPNTAAAISPLVTAPVIGGTTAATAASGGGILSTLAGMAKNPLFDAAGRMLQAGSQADAQNRGTKVDIGMEQEKLRQQQQRDYQSEMVARSQDDRAGQGDAWKKLQQASYVANWKPTGTNFSPYARPLTPPSTDVQQGATALMGQTRDDLMSGRFRTGGGAPPPLPVDPSLNPFTVDPNLVNPSLWERLQGYAGAGLSLLGNAKKHMIPGAA